MIADGRSIVGTSTTEILAKPPATAGMPPITRADTWRDYERLIRENRPSLVFNLLRGETAAGFDLHVGLARLCADIGCRYIYASSALVFEGHPRGLVLDEQARPCATTAYGSFKASCEKHLAEVHPDGDWQVLRFSSIQGWSPWKPSRNEVFLSKLSKGEGIRVDTGIIQNRLLDQDFARQVAEIAVMPAAKGILHLGTDDSSEEIDFLRRVALAFGWPVESIKAGPAKDCHIALACDRVHALTRGAWHRTEDETIEGLLREQNLAHFRRTP